MIHEIFKASIHSVGTATTMTAAGVYLHRRGLISSESKTGMARYTQQIAIPALFFSRIVDCPQDFSADQCPNILDHLGDAWMLLIWPIYVLGVGLLVGKLMIRIVKPPKWQNNSILAATAFANAMGIPITLLDVIGHNFQPPGNVNASLSPSLFQSIYVILNPVLQWGLGGWLLSEDDEEKKCESNYEDRRMFHPDGLAHDPLRLQLRRNFLSVPSLEDAGCADEMSPLVQTPLRYDFRGPFGGDTESSGNEEDADRSSEVSYMVGVGLESDESDFEEMEAIPERQVPVKSITEDKGWIRILKKVASKAMQPPAIGALAGFVVASYSPLRGLFVDLQNRADNAPLEWIFDGILTLANSAIPVNMCVVGVNLSIASERKSQSDALSADEISPRTIVAVVAGKMFVMPCIGIVTVWIVKTYFWTISEGIAFQFYLVLLMNFITPTANVVMVICELYSGPRSKNVMATFIGWQYCVAPFLLSLTVMMVVWTAVM